jgi:hypothetical protein
MLAPTHADTLGYLLGELSKVAEIAKNIEQTCSTIHNEQRDMHKKLAPLLMERTEAQHQDRDILWL